MLNTEKINKIASSIPGKYGLIIEKEDGSIIFEHEPNIIFPSASVIKLFIMWAIYKKIQKGELAEDTLISIDDEPVVKGCGILQQLTTKNLKLTVRDLTTLMIVLSDNMATNILIDLADMDFINSEMKSYGFKDSKLERHMMDGEARKRGLDNYTTPREQIQILNNIVNNEDISLSLRESMLDILSKQILENHAAQYIPLSFSFAHKTGNLASTLHDVGILTTPNGKYYVAVFVK